MNFDRADPRWANHKTAIACQKYLQVIGNQRVNISLILSISYLQVYQSAYAVSHGCVKGSKGGMHGQLMVFKERVVLEKSHALNDCACLRRRYNVS